MLDFDDCCDALLVSGLSLNPAELQGGFCGRLACGETLAHKDVIEFVAVNFALPPESLSPIEEVLHNIYTDTMAQANDPQGLIALLLPDENEELTVRLEALADWCRSYLSGLAQSGLSGDSSLAPEVVEAIRDLASVANVDSSDSQEDDEVSYTELVEFVKVASALIQVELMQQFAVPPQAHR